MKYAFLILCGLAVASARVIEYNPTATNETYSAIDNAIKKIIEEFRTVMPCGFDEYGVPPLAPFNLDELFLDITLPEVAGKGLLRNLHARDTHKFVVKKASFSILLLRLDIQLQFPTLHIRSDFENFNGRSQKNCFVTNGDGDARIDLKDLAVGVKVNLQITIRGKIQIKNIDVTASLKSSDIWINSFDNNNDACNREVSQTLPTTIKNNQKLVTKIINDLVKPIANKQLAELTLDDLLGLITGGGGDDGGLFPPCDIQAF